MKKITENQKQIRNKAGEFAGQNEVEKYHAFRFTRKISSMTPNKITPFLLVLLFFVFFCGCTEYAALPAKCEIRLVPIPKNELPAVDFQTTFGYAVFEGVLCQVKREDDKFSLLSLTGTQIFPSKDSMPNRWCWNETQYFSRDYSGQLSKPTATTDSKNSAGRGDANLTYPADTLAHLGDFYLTPNQRCPFYVMQYRDRIAFSSFQEIQFPSDYTFDNNTSSPIWFHNRKIRISKPQNQILFQDTETGALLQSSEYTGGRLIAAGVIGRGDESLLVIIKSIAPYQPKSEIWFFNSDFLRIDDKSVEFKLKSRHWSIFSKETAPYTLFLYKTFCGSQITEGYKIVLNTAK